MSSMIVWFGLLLAIGMSYAWMQNRTISTINRRLERYNKTLFEASDEIHKLQEQLEKFTTQMGINIRRNAGGQLFSPDMSVKEAQLMHPQARLVMASLNLGGCSTCTEDSLAKASRDHGVNLDVLLSNLNKLANNEPLNLLELSKLPNVQLELE